VSDIPETPTASARVLIGWFAGGLAFECVHQFSDGHTVSSVAYGMGAIAVAIFDYNLTRILAGSPRLTASLNRAAAHAGLWIGVAFLTLLLIALSPYFEERRWPFTARETKVEGPDTGSVVWNFEQTAKGNGYFLNMQKILNQPNQEIHVSGFGAHGKNVVNSPISNFKGYLRSDLTNVQIPIFISAQDPDDAKSAPVCVGQPWVPTVPEETFGIPPFADFDITTFEKPFIQAGVDGITLNKFMNDFVPFTVVLEYEGKKYERQFTKAEVERQVSIFERSFTAQSNPRVMRKANARRAPLTPLTTLLPADPPKVPPGLVSPIPPAGLPKIPAN
jgi:hypothetical protein